eukprot:1574020-Pleurochrysis_carterae.AAC.2
MAVSVNDEVEGVQVTRVENIPKRQTPKLRKAKPAYWYTRSMQIIDRCGVAAAQVSQLYRFRRTVVRRPAFEAF